MTFQKKDNGGMLDHLSKELREAYTPPKQGEVRIYRLTNIRKKKSKEGVSAYTVPNSRTVPDSYTVMDKGEPKSIVYTSRLLPTQDPNKVMRQAEPIEFRIENVGEIRITVENYATMAGVDKFLFFSPWVVPVLDSDGKSKSFWQTADKLGRFIELVDKQAEARKLLEIEDAKFDARAAINNMSEKDMELVIVQLKIGMPAYLTYEEKKAMLVKASQNVKQAKKISLMQGEEDMELRRFINKSIEHNIIKKTKSEKEYIWVQGLESIVKKMPGKTLEDSLIFFFKTEAGGEVKSMIELTIDAKSGSSKSKIKTPTTTI